MEKLLRLLRSPNDHSSRRVENQKMVMYVLAVGFIGALTLALMKINPWQMVILGFVFLAGLWLAIRGHTSLARWGSLIAALGLISSLMISNYGIRDTAVLGLMVVLISAGLIAGRRGTLIIGGVILLLIAAMSFLETRGIIVNPFSRYNFFADYLVVGLSIALVAILQWLLINQLYENIIKANRELAERELIEEKLRDAENRYRNLVERIPAVVYVAEPGINGKWHYISPQITAITGFTPHEWQSDSQFWFDQMHPDDRGINMELETHELKDGSMPRLEYRLKTKDGRYIWIYDEGLFFIDSQNQALVQGFMLDITARKMAEEQLKERITDLDAIRGVSEALVVKTDLKNLIEHTGDQIRATFSVSSLFIALMDTASNLIYFPYYYDENRPVEQDTPLKFGKGMTSSVMKTKRPLLINENWIEVSAKHGAIYYDNNPAKSSLTVPLLIGDHAIGAISMQDMEIEHAFTENDVRLLSTIAANLAVAIENTRLQESLKRELTIQEKLVAQLELKNAELERFTYTASHDLKSPLITIRGFLGYLEQDARIGNFERLHSDVKRISEATEKMHILLNELLELSRVGRVINEPQTLPFQEIVQEALKRVEGQLQARQVQVKVGSELPEVFGDAERLIEVIQNLVDNACKFMGEQKTPAIEIGAQKQAGENIFYVKDNGVGIHQKFHEKVFGLFDKLDPNTSGTGIGLALVKRIVEVHGGRVWIESNGVGEGATFYFTLSENPPPQ
ncbi:MAG: PAS domain S-box protein [Chloroflexi bacterium]|nr:PAS domain S-box protein [Chloroflexota bacterium]